MAVPDYVTTFELWSNYPLEVGQVDPLTGMEVLETGNLPADPDGHWPGCRWIGRKVTSDEAGS